MPETVKAVSPGVPPACYELAVIWGSIDLGFKILGAVLQVAVQEIGAGMIFVLASDESPQRLSNSGFLVKRLPSFSGDKRQQAGHLSRHIWRQNACLIRR